MRVKQQEKEKILQRKGFGKNEERNKCQEIKRRTTIWYETRKTSPYS
jgi:hypothetical protein